VATQTKRPTTVTDAGTGGTLSWTTPGNATGSDNAYATISFSGNEATSNWLYLSNFGFSLPSDATNIVLTLSQERKASVSLRAQDDPSILLDGVVQNDAIGSGGFFPTSDSVYTHFPYSLSSYTPTQINGSGFGIAVRVEFHNDYNTSDVTASIDDLYLLLTYDSTTAIGAHLGGSVGMRPLLGGKVGIRPLLQGRVGLR